MKVWLASKHMNQVAHRELSSFEKLNPKVLAVRYEQFATEEEAWAYRAMRCDDEVQDLERRLRLARLMKKKAAAKLQLTRAKR